jgi:hypothetical protein
MIPEIPTLFLKRINDKLALKVEPSDPEAFSLIPCQKDVDGAFSLKPTQGMRGDYDLAFPPEKGENAYKAQPHILFTISAKGKLALKGNPEKPNAFTPIPCDADTPDAFSLIPSPTILGAFELTYPPKPGEQAYRKHLYTPLNQNTPTTGTSTSTSTSNSNSTSTVTTILASSEQPAKSPTKQEVELFKTKINELFPEDPNKINRDAAKNMLQHICIHLGLRLPEYSPRIVGGNEHQPLWASTLTILDKNNKVVMTVQPGKENGSSKKDADKIAAIKGIAELKTWAETSISNTDAHPVEEVHNPNNDSANTHHASDSPPDKNKGDGLLTPPTLPKTPSTFYHIDSAKPNTFQSPIFASTPKPAIPFPCRNDPYKAPTHPEAIVLIDIENIPESTKKKYLSEYRVIGFVGINRLSYTKNNGVNIRRVMELQILNSNIPEAADHLLTFYASKLAAEINSNPNAHRPKFYVISKDKAAINTVACLKEHAGLEAECLTKVPDWMVENTSALKPAAKPGPKLLSTQIPPSSSSPLGKRTDAPDNPGYQMLAPNPKK